MLIWEHITRFIIGSGDIETLHTNKCTPSLFPSSFKAAVLNAELTGNVAKKLELCKLVPIRLTNSLGEGVHSIHEGDQHASCLVGVEAIRVFTIVSVSL